MYAHAGVVWGRGPDLLGRRNSSVRPRRAPNELRLDAVAKSWSDLWA